MIICSQIVLFFSYVGDCICFCFSIFSSYTVDVYPSILVCIPDFFLHLIDLWLLNHGIPLLPFKVISIKTHESLNWKNEGHILRYTLNIQRVSSQNIVSSPNIVCIWNDYLNIFSNSFPIEMKMDKNWIHTQPSLGR